MRRRARKGDALDRAIKALGRIGRTRSGRKFLAELGRDHGEAMVSTLGDLAGKP